MKDNSRICKLGPCQLSGAPRCLRWKWNLNGVKQVWARSRPRSRPRSACARPAIIDRSLKREMLLFVRVLTSSFHRTELILAVLVFPPAASRRVSAASLFSRCYFKVDSSHSSKVHVWCFYISLMTTLKLTLGWRPHLPVGPRTKRKWQLEFTSNQQLVWGTAVVDIWKMLARQHSTLKISAEERLNHQVLQHGNDDRNQHV